MNQIKKILFCSLFLFALLGCAGESIFIPIPLTLNPLVLANPISMAASSAARRLYIANSNNEVLWADASFAVLDLTNPLNPQAIAVISIPNFSGEIILDEPRGFVYIPNRESASEAQTVDHVLRININEASPNFLEVDLFDSGSNPFGAAVGELDTLFVAADSQALRYDLNNLNNFTAVDLNVTTAEGRAIDTDDTRNCALSPSGANLFVTNENDNMLILNVAQFPPPSSPGETDLGQEAVDYIVTGTVSTQGVASDSQFVYVVDASPPLLKVMTDTGLVPVNGPPLEIGSASLEVAAIPLGSEPGEILIDDPNRRAYVANTGSDDVSVIDLDLLTEINRVAVDENLPVNVDPGDQPFGMTLAEVDGVQFLYVANFNSNNITVIRTDTLKVVAAFPDIIPVDDEEDNTNAN
jgi:YVTN family beta-propeller protein